MTGQPLHGVFVDPSLDWAEMALLEHQARSAAALNARRSYAAPTQGVHEKERCPTCGLWRWKARACGHCQSRPNRAQARLAQARQLAQEAIPGQDRPRKPVGLGRVVMSDYRGASTPKDLRTHIKEKCQSCGLWVAKDMPCRHCVTRPNRAQAIRAMRTPKASPTPLPDRSFLWRSRLPRYMFQPPAALEMRSEMEEFLYPDDLGWSEGDEEEEEEAAAYTASRATLPWPHASSAVSSARRFPRPMSAPSLLDNAELGISGSISRRVILAD